MLSGVHRVVGFNSVLACGVVKPSRDVGTDGSSNRFRATDVIAFGAFGQGRQEGLVDSHRNHLPGAVPSGLPPTLAEPIDVVTSFGLVCPVLDVLVGDRLAVDLLHP